MSKKPVVLYPEGLYPDLEVETPIFGPTIELRLRSVSHYSELSAEDREDVTGLMVFRYRVPKEDMALFPNLKAICRMGVGYDRLDREEAARRGIIVQNLPDYGTTEVADHAIALMLCLRRGLLPQYTQSVTPPHTYGLIRSPTILRQSVQTLGIVGIGRIGTAVALRAKALGMSVVVYDPYAPNGVELALGVRRVRDLNELCKQSHVLSLHAPQTPETINMISHEQFAVMPPNAIIINTARGTLIDFDALHEALKSNKIAGAGLDCIPQEPPVDIHPLLQAYRDREAWLDGRMIVTSHVAYWSPQAEADIRRLSAETMASAVVEGRKPQNVIDPSSW